MYSASPVIESIVEDFMETGCYLGFGHPSILKRHGVRFFEEEQTWLVIDTIRKEIYEVHVGDFSPWPRA